LTCVTDARPFPLHQRLNEYKHDCLEYGLNTEYFHCSEDNAHVRHRVFEAICDHLGEIRIDALIVEKRKTGPALRVEQRFYPEMLGYLLRYVIEGINPEDGEEEVVVITDTLPLKRKRSAIEKGIRGTLRHMLPPARRFRVLHHASKSHFGLQVADYCNWAILRKWTRGESEHYDRIRPAIKSEFEIFRAGKTLYY
jgi:hypothetical protein